MSRSAVGKKRTLTDRTITQSRKKPALARPGAFTANSPPTKKLKVFVFGEGSSGELGLGPSNATEVARARHNPKLAGIINISPGGMHAAALTPANSILTWGINDDGTLGRDTNWEGGMRDIDAEGSDSGSDLLSPVESTPSEVLMKHFPTGTKFCQVDAGDSTTFVLTADGSVYGWGTFRDGNGKLGFSLDPSTGKIIEVQREPKLLSGLKDIKQISVGSNFVLALDARGSVFAWGCGDQSELGHRLVKRRRLLALLPTIVGFPKRTRIASVFACVNHAFAIDVEGNTWSWGSNNFGQTGIRAGAGEAGSTICPPQKIPALHGTPMKMVHGGLHHSIGLARSGECFVWGRMDGFQMGLSLSSPICQDSSKVLFDSREKPRILLDPTPLPIPPCVHVAAGSDNCFAVTQDGKAYSWGFNATYQCGQGTSDDIEEATLMKSKDIRDEKIVWAGGGGQYGLLASYM